MLFVLTGGVQIGKTRWLESLVRELKSIGIAPRGVIAPGVWADRRDDRAPSEHIDANGFEKLGIDNVLLPDGERIAFARRTDLAECDGTFNPCSQSARAKLRWHISDNAIELVNDHFSRLAQANATDNAPGILIVDELGQLELKRDEGLTEAIALLEAGPAPTTKHALIVVRESLLPLIEGRFGRWGEKIHIRPDEASSEAIIATVRTHR